LLSSDEAMLKDLTPEQKILWNSFERDQIYRFLTSEPDTMPN
jgi:hypothetical protein